MRVLVANAGSSNLKLRVIAEDDVLTFSAGVPVTAGRIDQDAIVAALDQIGSIDATGHRFVHGGALFTEAVMLDEHVGERLRSLVPLAPLHQPLSLAAADAIAAALPDVPAIACFDTSFHASLPPAAATYALPREWRDRFAIRRYGFHGLSHAYVAGRAAEILRRPIDQLGMVTCHLGAGASLAAVKSGESMDTTMGFTPLEGLVMATRSGSVDPGLLLWLQQSAGLSVEEISEGLERQSGLKGLAGTPDMDAVIQAAGRDDPEARLALDVYIHRLCAGVAAMAAALEGLDALVFTGGVGENAPLIRGRTAARLGFFGIELDAEKNEAMEGDTDISSHQAPVRTVVVSSREDIQIAREVRRILA